MRELEVTQKMPAGGCGRLRDNGFVRWGVEVRLASSGNTVCKTAALLSQQLASMTGGGTHRRSLRR